MANIPQDIIDDAIKIGFDINGSQHSMIVMSLHDLYEFTKLRDERQRNSGDTLPTEYSMLFKLSAQMAMKQNMPDVQHVTHSVNIPKKSWRSIIKMCSKSTQQCNDWSYELRKIADRLSAAPSAPEATQSQAPKKESTYCSVHKADKSTCQLHNLQCAYPACIKDAPDTQAKDGE